MAAGSLPSNFKWATGRSKEKAMNGKVAAVWILGASVIAAVACSGSDETGNPTAAGGLGGSAGSTAGGVSSGGKASGGKANGGSAGESTSAAGVAGVSAGGAPSAGAGGASGAPPLAQAIVYYSGAATAREIWVMDPDGMNALALTANSDADVDPQLSPDGTKIVFQRSIAGANDIWVMNADGSNEVDLTSDCTENDGQPSWSPDSQFIAYVSRCDDPTYTKLYRAPADGSSP
ncbi:MAG TPA: hypothetical protein VGP93_03105, partial [Polyangiaceae bacterium]|nr:hypothetical protein [Polyangiaceae bacterium]